MDFNYKTVGHLKKLEKKKKVVFEDGNKTDLDYYDTFDDYSSIEELPDFSFRKQTETIVWYVRSNGKKWPLAVIEEGESFNQEGGDFEDWEPYFEMVPHRRKHSERLGKGHKGASPCLAPIHLEFCLNHHVATDEKELEHRFLFGRRCKP